MGWSVSEIAGKSADVFVPSGPENPNGIVLFLHGYDGVTLKDNPSYTKELTKHNLIGLCPLGPQCWWTDAVYAPFDEERSPVDFLAQEIPNFCRTTWQIEPPKIAVCGVEMGGQGALQ